MNIRELPQSAVDHLVEYNEHEAVYELYDKASLPLGFIAVHRKNVDVPSMGATRLLYYTNPTDALRDALRLSNLMTYKAAAAELPYGGAKGVLMMPAQGAIDRRQFFTNYATCVNELQGMFVTGTDVGLTADDLAVLVEYSPYMIGYGVDAAYYTSIGVLHGIQAALQYLDHTDELFYKRFALQGVGKTGLKLLQLLVEWGAREIIISDINDAAIEQARAIAPFARVVDPQLIHTQLVDVFCPCALGGILNTTTIPELRCRAVVGSANNQLICEEDALALFARGIVYIPDYIANAGGLLSVVSQYENKYHDVEQVGARLNRLQRRIEEIITQSSIHQIPTTMIAQNFVYA